ncbi:MAG TPA: cobyrinate a,c-diamide synthase [Candidatus Megamonas gallistercoris]|nr:cobyrinate a,c-diamide synthase [Candidatus Megamonas gallistercoris]
MNRVNIPRVVIAATQSSSGKTTVVTGILRALKNKGMKVQPFKVGPDYIDPSYHGMAAGRAGHNLDTWLVDESRINDLFASEAENADIAIIEGVMGLYDGGKNGISSTAQLAKKLQAPVILVINVQSMGDSAAAIALGFKLYDEEVNLAGVILNRLGSPTHKMLIEEAMARINVPVFGAVYRDDSVHMPERHLGLTPAQENNAKEIIEIISAKIAKEVYLDEIIKLACAAPPLEVQENKQSNAAKDIVIAVAKDKAFSFYYPASLKQLSDCGAKIEFFSPLEDETIPSDASALIFGGGFPEIFADKLAANKSMLTSIRRANENKMPIYAECGGYMYLMQGIFDFDGNFHAMAGIIPATAKMNKKLQTVGYVKAKNLHDNILGEKDCVYHGHEFHFSTQSEEAQDFPWAFEFVKMRNNAEYKAGYAKDNILGSYLHLHFLGSKKAADCLLEKAKEYYKNRTKG